MDSIHLCAFNEFKRVYSPQKSWKCRKNIANDFIWNTDISLSKGPASSTDGDLSRKGKCYWNAVVWVFQASLNRDEDSEPCLYWASVDWHNICSALDQNETFITRRSSAREHLLLIWKVYLYYEREQFTAKLSNVSPYLRHFTGNRIQGHHCFIFSLNMKQVLAWIDYYFIQICPNTGFIPALIYQALGCLLPRSF